MEFKGEDRSFGGNELFVDPVPKTQWNDNARYSISEEDWDTIRKFVYIRAGYRCEVCGSKGRIEAHERWHFDDTLRVQKLVRLVALCSDCHEATHLGLTRKRGKEKKAFSHLLKVTGMTEWEAMKHIEESYRVVAERSKYKYSLDLGILTDSGMELLTGNRSFFPENSRAVETSRNDQPEDRSDIKDSASAKETPIQSPVLSIIAMVVLVIGSVLFVSKPWRKSPPEPLPVIETTKTVVRPKYLIFHWKHGMFRCRTDHSAGRPWGCVRIVPPKLAEKSRHISLHITKNTAKPSMMPPAPPMDPLMSLPIWKGPWPVAWTFTCSLPRNEGRWTAAWRPALHNGHLQEGVGVYGYATLFAKVRIQCPK